MNTIDPTLDPGRIGEPDHRQSTGLEAHGTHIPGTNVPAAPPEVERESYHRGGLVKGGLALVLIAGTQFSLMVLFIALALGAPVWSCMVLLMLSLFGMVRLLSANIEYSLSSEGLQRTVHPKVLRNRRFHTTDTLGWQQMAWYRIDTELNRSFRRYPFIQIKPRENGPSWRIEGHDMQDAAFNRFQQAFLAYGQAHALLSPSLLGTASGGDDSPTHAPTPITNGRPLVRRRASRYASPWAKILAITAIAVDILLVILTIVVYGTLPWRILWRFALVLVPGTGYVVYRAFRKNGH
ncbi:MAG: hypothetical protein AB9828_06375 [Sphaerochaetaceae bacterium]